MLFEKPTMEMTKHLKPLYIKAHIYGRSFNMVFGDGGGVLNLMSLANMVRFHKNSDDLIPTNINMTSLMGHVSHALGVLIAGVEVGSKFTRFTFFVKEGKPSYVFILGSDWINTSECVPSILHQKIMPLIGDKVEVIEVDQNPFLVEFKMLEATFYPPHLGPLSIPKEYDEGGVEIREFMKKGFKLKTLADVQPTTKSND